MSRHVITGVEVIPLMTPGDPHDLDGSYDTVLVRVHDDAGNIGTGETDAPAEVIARFIEMQDLHEWSRGLRSMLLGQDPFPISSLFDRLYEGSIYPGRRGLGIHALSALDMALYDLVGKELGRPAYELLGGARRERLRPYGTVWPGTPQGRSAAEVMVRIKDIMTQLVESGLRAIKMEVIFGDIVDDRGLVALIHEGRRHLGDDITMMVDFGYRWWDWRSALWVLERIDDCDIFFAEAPIEHDNLEGHARLADRSPIRIGGAEFSATRFESLEWLRTGRVDILQPDVNRCGGLTEASRIASLASYHAAVVIPHGYKTGITAAAERNLQASTSNCPYFEYLSPVVSPSPLRRGLTFPEPTITDGTMSLPEAPGLGIELDEELVSRYRVDAPGDKAG